MTTDIISPSSKPSCSAPLSPISPQKGSRGPRTRARLAIRTSGAWPFSTQFSSSVITSNCDSPGPPPQ